MYSPIGKTLAEVAKDYGASLQGYAVFVLEDESDQIGTQIGKEMILNFSVKSILRKYPEYASYKVKYTNDFFGETVFRVIKEGAE